MRRALILMIVLGLASVAAAEILHPGGGSQPLEGLPLRTEFGGTGNSSDSFVPNECVEATLDDNGTADTSDDLIKLKTSGFSCGTTATPTPTSTMVTATPTPTATHTPETCGAGYAMQGISSSRGIATCIPVPATPTPTPTTTGTTPTPTATSTPDYEEEAQIGTTAITGNAAEGTYLKGTGTGFGAWQSRDLADFSGVVLNLRASTGSPVNLDRADVFSILAGSGITTTVTSGAQAGTVTVARAPSFLQTADASVSNTSTETSILGAGTGSLVFAANSFIVGSTLHIRTYGTRGTKTTGPGNITIALRFGSTVIASRGPDAQTANVPATQSAGIEAWCTVRSVGVTGSISCHGFFHTDESVLGIAPSFWDLSATAEPVTFDTTASNTLGVSVTYSVADTANIITTQNAIVEVIY